AENNPPSLYTSRHYEVCKYYSIDEHNSIPDVLIISTQVWNSLSKDEKKWLSEAVIKSVPVQRKLWEDSEKESLIKIEEAGVKIYYPDKELFSSKVQGIYDLYKKNPVISSYIKRIKQVK
ncbi:MAG: TRAP transporter substrate-binding protein DctP, partial [bacterium]